MATDSSQPGYLAPVTDALYDLALEDFFQAFIVGITGLPGNLVRPRWQPKPGNQPPPTSEWIAFGVSLGKNQWNAYQHFLPDGSYAQEGVEEIKMALSFYGTNNFAVQRRFEAGLQIGQHLDVLDAQKIEYKDLSTPVNVPVLLKENWHLRSDVTATFQRWVTRIYPIKPLLSVDVAFKNDLGASDVHAIVNPPPLP